MSMISKLDMIDVGVPHYILGLRDYQSGHDTFVFLKEYILNSLKKFNMFNCKTFSTPINMS